MGQLRRNHRDFDALFEKYGERLRFPVYLGPAFTEALIEELNLSVRSYNCLKRAGICTVGDLVERIDNRTDLLKIRNLGTRSADEIMEAIMDFQYSLLSYDDKARYLKRVAEMNE